MFSKKILHLYSSVTAGGAEKLMLSLAQGLDKEGLKDIVVAPKRSYAYEQALKMGLEAYPLTIKGSFDPLGILGLAKIVVKEGVDILHAHQGKVFWPCVMIKKFVKPDVKVVFHRHAHLPHKFYSRGHYKSADRIIAISKIVADDLERLEKVPREKIRVIYNGTDFKRFSPEVGGNEVKKFYDLFGKNVIGTVGQMNKPKGKGQMYLIEAAAKLRERFPDNRYLIVGNGPILEDLKKLSAKLKVSDIIIFPGYQEMIEKFIAAMDVLCFLSWDREGFGQVMVEAQGMGKPVIGTDIGGIPETFQNGVTGFLIPPENSDILSGAIAKLLTQKNLAAEMGRNAIKFVNDNFSLEKMSKNVLAVYRELYNSEAG